MLEVRKLRKLYTRSWLDRTPTFRLSADFTIERPGIVGMMGPNGSGKTTLFELVTGLALVTSPLFRVVPRWYVALVEGVFGSRAHILQFHIALGVAWIAVALPVLLLLGLAAGLVALRRRLWPRPGDPLD